MRAERLNTGTVFSRIFSIYRRQAAVLLPAAAALYVIPAALNVPKGITAQALALATSFIATVCLQGIVAQAVRDISDDVRDLPLTGLLRSLPPVLAPLMWTAILILVGAFLGSLAFVIPGLILLTVWAVAAPVVVIEHLTPVKALGRSGELVRGNGWRVFGVLVVTAVLTVMADLALISVAASISDTRPVIAAASFVADIVATPLLALASAVLYLELRALKGEPPPPATAI